MIFYITGKVWNNKAIFISGKINFGGKLYITAPLITYDSYGTYDTIDLMTQFPLLHSREEDSSFQCMSAQWIQSGNYLNVSSADCSEELTIVCRKILFVKPVCSDGSFAKPVTKPRLETLMSAALNRANKLAIAHKKAEMKDMMKRLNQSGSFESLFATLWYSSMPCYDVRGITSLSKSTLTSMLIYCEWKGVSIPCSEIFVSVPTDQGICCAFNMNAAEELYIESR